MVLDLFAGTGALGLEALSRGAARVVFVDDGAKASVLIRQNIELTRSLDCAQLIRRNATRLGAAPGAQFDLVFLDPPYGKALGEKALAEAQQGGWLAPEALIVWEENVEKHAPHGFERLDARRYGDTWVHVLRLAE